jgi:hypothetical protein
MDIGVMIAATAQTGDIAAIARVSARNHNSPGQGSFGMRGLNAQVCDAGRLQTHRNPRACAWLTRLLKRYPSI